MSIINKIVAGVIFAEGVCASVVVDEALKAVNCNKIIKYIGRSTVSTMITAYSVAEAMKVLSADKEDDGKHSVTIDLPHAKNLKMRYAPGEVVTISADEYLLPGEDFIYWHADKGHVDFEDEASSTTTFIMPDEKVKITFAIGIDMAAKKAAEENAEDPEPIPEKPVKVPDNEISDAAPVNA